MPAHFRTDIGSMASASTAEIIGALTQAGARSGYARLEHKQTVAWQEECTVLRSLAGQLSVAVPECRGWGVLLEYPIPLRQKRLDAVLLAPGIVFVLEFKSGASSFARSDMAQVEDYCLDLRDFHEETGGLTVVPILVATKAVNTPTQPVPPTADAVQPVICCDPESLFASVVSCVRTCSRADAPRLDCAGWDSAGYRPVPGILAAARALFGGHNVREISRAHADNLTATQDRLAAEIVGAQRQRQKVICFVTGIPGAGKTLAGLNLVHSGAALGTASGLTTFLSGNGPLVRVMRAALAADHRLRARTTKQKALRVVSTQVQNVHDFLRQYTQSTPVAIPYHRVVVFDEAQRAWDQKKASSKFQRSASEPAAMLSVMDRHRDWAVLVALVGGGQEIHTGEAGLAEWGRALLQQFSHWRVVAAPEALHGGVSVAGTTLFGGGDPPRLALTTDADLHLGVSVRAFRAETFADWVNHVLGGDAVRAAGLARGFGSFPVVITRRLDDARRFLRANTRGQRRSGLLTSSGAVRLRAYGVEVSSEFRQGYPFEEWWLAGADDVRSSYQLEVAATEFECQGLELDWACLCWANDLTWESARGDWRYRQFRGSRWQATKAAASRSYLLNKYRVLLTRARDGLVIFVPAGSSVDPTLDSTLFDETAEYLLRCGVASLPQ